MTDGTRRYLIASQARWQASTSCSIPSQASLQACLASLPQPTTAKLPTTIAITNSLHTFMSTSS